MMLPVGSKNDCAQGLSVKQAAEMTTVQPVSPVVSMGTRIVHNATDSTRRTESANSPSSAALQVEVH